MKVYFVRHGLTEGNVGGTYQTESTPLTREGIGQAKQIAKRLVNHKIDLIYSSPHFRAINTSKIISQSLNNIPIESWNNLVEIRRPKEIRGKHPNEPGVSVIESLMNKNFGLKNRRISDEENFYDVAKRGQMVLEHLAQKHTNQNVLCVSHGTFIKMVFSIILLKEVLTPDAFFYIRHHLFIENTGLTVCEYSKDRGWSLLTWNDTSHL
jgi:broad specificity phosphatase PhoE